MDTAVAVGTRNMHAQRHTNSNNLLTHTVGNHTKYVRSTVCVFAVLCFVIDEWIALLDNHDDVNQHTHPDSTAWNLFVEFHMECVYG